MSGGESGRVFGLFQNGKAEWIRWMVAMAIGASVNYGVTQSRIAVLESRMNSNESALIRAIDGLTQEIRDVRAAVYGRTPTTIIETLPETETSRPLHRLNDRLPRFSADDQLGVGHP